MTMNHDQYRDLIPAYVLGALEGFELQALEAHLATECDECNAELLEASRDLEALAASNAPVAASETTRARLLAEVARTPARPEASVADEDPFDLGRPAPERSGGGWLPLAAAAALLLLAWSGWSQLELRRELQALRAQATTDSARLASLEKDLGRARRQLGRFSLANRILASPGLETVLLAGLEAAPEASGRALVTAEADRALFYVANLPQVNDDQTYQLWVIAGGQPIDAGLFSVDTKGRASVVLEKLETEQPIEAWAVTIEPAGGVPQPTGPMVLMGATA